MEGNYKNKVFRQIFLWFFLLFFLILAGIIYNEDRIQNKQTKIENERFIDLILSSSKENMEFLENYLNTFKNNTDFLKFISSEKYTPSHIYRLQKLLQRDRDLLRQENIDLGIINLEKASVIFTDMTYDLYNYQRITKLQLFDVKDNFLHLEGDYLVKYIPFRLSEGSDRIIFVLRLKKSFLQRIFRSSERISWYIREEDGYLNLREFNLVGEVSQLMKGRSSGLLRENIYYKIDSDSEYIKPDMIWILLIGIILIGGVSYLLTKLIFKLAYKPLEDKLVGEKSKARKYIHEHLRLKGCMSRLTRERGLMEDQLNSSNPFLTAGCLKDFIGGIISYSDLKERLPEESVVFHMKNYHMTIVKVATSKEVQEDSQYSSIKNEVKRIFQENLQEAEGVDLNHNTVLFISDCPEDKRGGMEKIKVYLETRYPIKLDIICSSKLRNLNEVQREYSTLIRYLEYNLDTGEIVTRDNVKNMLKRRYYYPIALENKLIERITKGSIDLAKGLAIKVFYENLQVRSIDHRDQNTLKVLMLNTLKRVNNTINMNEEGSGRIEQLINRLTLTEERYFEDEYLKSLEVIVRCIGREEKSQEGRDEKSHLREKVEKFIEENYMKEIGLQDLADHVGYSQHYMSHVFKGLFQDSFRSKINNYRIRKAKEVIAENKNIKVYELAKRVGYNSSSSFIKIFKSVEGCSPGIYKDKIS